MSLRELILPPSLAFSGIEFLGIEIEETELATRLCVVILGG